MQCINSQILVIHQLLTTIVKKYYPHENLDSHPQFINLQKAYELIATTVPLMLSLPCALDKRGKQFSAPSLIHPSSADLKPLIDRTINCYQAYYGTICHSTDNDLDIFIKHVKKALFNKNYKFSLHFDV